jgi:membrane-bound ClpP family serine protease
LIGEIGVVKRCRGSEGKVLVHGELWQARFSEPCAEGARVVVERVEQLVLVVNR